MVGIILPALAKLSIRKAQMSRESGLEETGVIKLLLFLLSFLLMCMVVIFLLIVPSIKEYKAAKLEHNDKIVNLNKIKQIYNANLGDLNSLKSQSKKSLDAISSRFNEIKFISGTSRFFSNVKLAKLPKLDANETFLRYELNVTGSIKTPQNFYNFLDYMNDYDNVIRVDFPVSMKSRDNKINTSFQIKVYEAE